MCLLRQPRQWPGGPWEFVVDRTFDWCSWAHVFWGVEWRESKHVEEGDSAHKVGGASAGAGVVPKQH